MSLSQRILFLFAMVFMHVVADFCLQGAMASLKQIRWWEQQPAYKTNKRKYCRDYLTALVAHSFHWSFFISIPAIALIIVKPYAYDCLGWVTLLMILVNTFLHSLVDNEKANRHSINLVVDQLSHLFQIMLTWILMMAAI